MSSTSTAILPEYSTYLTQLFPVDDDLTRELKARAQELEVPKIWISTEQAAIMQWLIRTLNVRRVLEIGTLVGYSSMMMARALPDDGQIVTLEMEQKFIDLAQEYWQKAGVDSKIEVIKGDAMKTMPGVVAKYKPFDFVFIDADKENYPAYLEMVVNCTTPNAVIGFDNAFAFGYINDEESEYPEVLAIRELNRRAANDDRFHASLLPVGDGLLLLTKKGN